MNQPPPNVVNAYTALIEQAVIRLRYRIRYGDVISTVELHDWLDALHNVPIMLRNYGGWHIEANIDQDLARYDSRWLGRIDSKMRRSLVETLQCCKDGEFDRDESWRATDLQSGENPTAKPMTDETKPNQAE